MPVMTPLKKVMDLVRRPIFSITILSMCGTSYGQESFAHPIDHLHNSQPGNPASEKWQRCPCEMLLFPDRESEAAESYEKEQLFELCRSMADSGDTDAQFELGLLYLEGAGVEADEDEAISWLQLSLSQGHPRANELLEYLYENEFGFGC